MRFGDIVEITWLDSGAHAHWENEKAPGNICVIKSAGYVIQRDKKQTTLTIGLDTENTSRLGHLAIPNAAITNIRKLGRKS